MHRLFVALRPPPAIRSGLLALMGGVVGARWQDDEQLHLTLGFIGEVEPPQAEDIAIALGTVTHPRAHIALAGLGTFDRKGRPHTLWAGIAPDEGLRILHQRVNRALAGVGVPPDERGFTPDITLARLGRDAGPIAPFLARAADLASPSYALDAFLLYESILGRGGSTYHAVGRYPLT